MRLSAVRLFVSELEPAAAFCSLSPAGNQLQLVQRPHG
jgi:hypothetical protein